MCSEFSDFLADKDKLCTAKDSENKENIEDYIEPSNQSYTNSICDEIINDVDPEDDKLSKYSYNLLIIPVFYQHAFYYNNLKNVLYLTYFLYFRYLFK